MPPSVYVALLALLTVPAATECEGSAECEDAPMIQVSQSGRKLNLTGPCQKEVQWPCTTPVVSSFALQVVNSDSDTTQCKPENVATVGVLNINTGAYAAICKLPAGICVNACGIDPTSNLAFCVDRPGQNNLLRIDCDFTGKLNDLATKYTAGSLGTFTAVDGEVCYYGLLRDTMQGAFDGAGNFWFLRGSQRVYKITKQNIPSTGLTTFSSTAIPGSIDEFLIGAAVENVADIVAVSSDFENPGGTRRDYLVGCFQGGMIRPGAPIPPGAPKARVWVQQVSGVTDPPPKPIELFITSPNPSFNPPEGSSGAAWSFNNRIFCAYNNKDQGVYEPLLSTVKFRPGPPGADRRYGTVEVEKRSPSDEKISNDGMNCMNAAAPFRPFATPASVGPSSVAPTSIRPSSITPTSRISPAASITPTNIGGGEGDPHIHTLDGEHYLLLNQGSFSFWRYSGVDAEVQSKKAPVDFEVFAHYSGHSSYTKGLLLVDRSGALGAANQVMELTAEDCRWRAKKSDGSWQPVEKPTVLAIGEDGDEMTAFNVARSKGQKMHVEFLMKSGAEGFKKIGTLYATCKPHHHINMKMAMFSKDDVRLVKGQLGAHSHDTYLGSRSERMPATSLLETLGQKLKMDQNFLTSRDWTELGGSVRAKAYLKKVDEEGVALLQSCSKEMEGEARTTCSKFLGNPPAPQESLAGRTTNFKDTFEDCVFDVCTGGGEAAAELAAEIMNAF